MMTNSFQQRFHRWFKQFCRILMGLVVGWFFALVEVLRLLHRRRPAAQPVRICIPLPPHVHKKADPLIYCQQDLMAHGIAVTWDNPDIEIQENGVVVPPGQLDRETKYDVVARIWNSSGDAPAVDLLVVFSFLSFGIGTVKTKIGETRIDLGAKGTSACPAFASCEWLTPGKAGHYCLQVELVWSDDANPNNNLGQKNTDVGKFNSPNATFKFPLHNAAGSPRTFELRADSYKIPPRPACTPSRDKPPISDGRRLSNVEREAAYRRVAERNGRGAYPITSGWKVTITPDRVELPARESTEVTVVITAPTDPFVGRETFNINAFDREMLIGGVTLIAED